MQFSNIIWHTYKVLTWDNNQEEVPGIKAWVVRSLQSSECKAVVFFFPATGGSCVISYVNDEVLFMAPDIQTGYLLSSAMCDIYSWISNLISSQELDEDDVYNGPPAEDLAYSLREDNKEILLKTNAKVEWRADYTSFVNPFGTNSFGTNPFGTISTGGAEITASAISRETRVYIGGSVWRTARLSSFDGFSYCKLNINAQAGSHPTTHEYMVAMLKQLLYYESSIEYDEGNIYIAHDESSAEEFSGRAMRCRKAYGFYTHGHLNEKVIFFKYEGGPEGYSLELMNGADWEYSMMRAWSASLPEQTGPVYEIPLKPFDLAMRIIIGRACNATNNHAVVMTDNEARDSVRFLNNYLNNSRTQDDGVCSVSLLTVQHYEYVVHGLDTVWNVYIELNWIDEADYVNRSLSILRHEGHTD